MLFWTRGYSFILIWLFAFTWSFSCCCKALISDDNSSSVLLFTFVIVQTKQNKKSAFVVDSNGLFDGFKTILFDGFKTILFSRFKTILFGGFKTIFWSVFFFLHLARRLSISQDWKAHIWFFVRVTSYFLDYNHTSEGLQLVKSFLHSLEWAPSFRHWNLKFLGQRSIRASQKKKNQKNFLPIFSSTKADSSRLVKSRHPTGLSPVSVGCYSEETLNEVATKGFVFCFLPCGTTWGLFGVIPTWAIGLEWLSVILWSCSSHNSLFEKQSSFFWEKKKGNFLLFFF